MSTAPDSPLARLRASYQARQKVAPARYVDIWDDGSLVARLARASDIASARAVMRTVAVLIDGSEDTLTVTEDDLADVVAMATAELCYRDEGGKNAPLGDGAPLRFDGAYGAAIGVPEVATPRGAVFAAFSSPVTEGGPAELDTLALMATASAIAFTLAGMSEEATAMAERAVGEPSAPEN